MLAVLRTGTPAPDAPWAVARLDWTITVVVGVGLSVRAGRFSRAATPRLAELNKVVGALRL